MPPIFGPLDFLRAFNRMTGGNFGFAQTSVHIPVGNMFSYGQPDWPIASGNRSPTPSIHRRELSVELKSILRKTIQEKGLTVTSVARASKVPVQTIHGWLQGSEPKSVRQLKAVADYLDVDLDYLCFGIKPKSEADKIEVFKDEINAGVFEVVLRRIKK